MADSFRFPFKRSINYTGAYRLPFGAASLPILDDMQFDVVATVHNITASGIETGAPVVGTPSLSQVHALAAIGVATAAPTIGTPSLGQVHALAVTGFSTGAPTIGTPSLAGEEPEVVGGTSRNKPNRRAYPLQPQFLPQKPETVTVSLGAVSILTGTPTTGAPWLVELFDTTAIDEDLILFAA